MSEPTKPETPAERAEARAIRRRWITLGELVAVAGVIIAGLSWWNNYSERKSAEAEKQAEKASEAKAVARVTLTATPVRNGKTLRLAAGSASIQSVRVRFPSDLGLGARESLAEPRIEAGWFDSPLLKLTDGGADEQEGTLPVLITAEWWDGDKRLSDTSLYDVVWETEARPLLGREVRLKGLVLRQRVTGDGAAPLDAAWARSKPAKT